MSNKNGNDQELAYSQPENGKNANNDKQQKKKPLTAFVQMAFDGPANGQEVELCQDCSTVAEHVIFLKDKINESQGSIIGLQLNGPVERAAVLKGNVALVDDKVPLKVDFKYTFKFKLAKVPEEKVEDTESDLIADLAIQMAKLAEEKNELKMVVEVQAEMVANFVEEQVKNMAKSAKDLAKCQVQLQQLTVVKDALKKGLEEQEKKWVKHQKLFEEAEAKEEQRLLSAEYARLIGVPNVANLRAHYNREKLTHLLKHGNVITPSIYIQKHQYLNDPGLLQCIVDKLATAEKPAQLVGEVKIEYDGRNYFTWPKREELKLKDKNQVTLTFNEATGNPETHSGTCYSAEYELSNRGCRFQVLIHHANEYGCFNKLVSKFIYRRLP